MNSFSHMVNVLENPFKVTVTTEQYIEWKRQYVFDTLRGYRLGQSFCKYFGISNASPLYHFKSNSFSDQWIHDNYIDNEEKVC